MGHLSTHALDTAHGCPAAGMHVTLQRVDAAEHDHVPLLVSPWSYSSCRGS